MRFQLPIWQSVYAHDKRAHRHRCFCCNRIINTGEQVVMFRKVGLRGTKTMHADCVNQRFGGADSDYTYKDMAVFSAIEYNVNGLSLSPKAVFKAASENEIAKTVDFSRDRLFAFGFRLEGWPTMAVTT